ncbi:MAG: carboxypeptidase-like regulatory domain-containing protein [Saprospiraceae bacterium]|nr:carboxypeptidase-like regulatory domain-containing protein [Saprospiraceae bacterium]
MKHFIFCCVLAGATLPAFAQKTITGRVSEAPSGEALAYVSIGIPGTSIGTVSGEDGRFTLEIPEKTALSDRDSMQFYLLGYRPQTMPFGAAVSGMLDIRLEPGVLQLREVVIRPDETRLKVLGKVKSKYRMVVNYALEGKINQNLGAEIGRRFTVKKPTRLESFQFFVAANNFDTVRFRINVYDLQKGKPGDNLLHEQIIVPLVGKKTGWVKVDLQAYEVYAEDDLVVGVEWIYGSKGGTELTIPIAMPAPGSKHFYKYGSRNRWKAFTAMSAAMTLEVRQ